MKKLISYEYCRYSLYIYRNNLLALFPANIFLCSIYAHPLVHGIKTNSSTLASLRNATISVHTKNVIQASSFNKLKKEPS